MVYPLRLKGLLLVIIGSLLICSAVADECNDTHMDYFSEYSLGKQDELNKTFTKIGEKVTSINSVTWKVNETSTFWIENIKPTFFYIDSKQKAEITGNDTIVIDGGYLQATLDFTWRKSDGAVRSGTGKAVGISDEVVFAKTMKFDKGFITEEVIDIWDIKWSQKAFSIKRIDPPSTPFDDVERLERMLNDIVNVTTARHELEEEIHKYYFYYLNLSLYDERRHIDEHFDYVYENSFTKRNVSVPFHIEGTLIDVEPSGITMFLKANIEGYTGWKCEYHGPRLPLNPKVYGGRQEFLTFDIYKNLVRYAAERHYLDTDLSRAGWQSRFFQFFAGDLYEVIPKLTEKFYASELVTGSCQTSPAGLEMIKGSHETINVTLNYDCELNINKNKILGFRVNLGLNVHGRANRDTVDFHVVHFNQTSTFTPYMDYKVVNLQLAQHMVTHSLNRLMENKVFGSGWKIYTRDYPHFIVEDNYTVIYDSTHVDPDNGSQDETELEYEEESVEI